MKQNSRVIQVDEISLDIIIRNLLKEKFLILSVSLVFFFGGYFYEVNKPKIYKLEVVLRDPPKILFEEYRFIFKDNLEYQLSDKYLVKFYIDEFRLNLLNLNSLVEFVEQNNEIDNFKSYLKKNNITVADYFRGKFDFVVEKNKSDLPRYKYALIFTEHLDGEVFLKNFINFNKNKTNNIFRNQLANIIQIEIKNIENELEIARKLDLNLPTQPSAANYRKFHTGTTVLTKDITNLNTLLNKSKSFNFNYDLIFADISTLKTISISPILFATAVSFLGIFFSLIIIFIKNFQISRVNYR
ncbi:hypothetical protein MCEMKE138_00242 [Candidatus Pelagibacterales bacterium]